MMTAKFVAEEGVLKGLVLPLEEGKEWIIGRDPDNCQFVVEDPEADRIHAKCVRTADGITIENLSSLSPVEVNGEPISEPRRLEPEDIVKIGSSLFRFYDENEEKMDESLGGHQTEHENGRNLELEGVKMSEVESNQQGIVTSNSGQPEEDLTPAEELLKDELEERRDVEAEQKSPAEEDDIFAEDEHAKEAEKYTAQRKPHHEEKMTTQKEEEMDTIFQDEAAEKEKDLLAEVNFDILETGRWLLKVVGGPNTGAEFSMQSATTYLIGTDPNTCDIVFHDTSVSRQHARITVSDEDTLLLEDLKSRNGTMLDGKKVEGRIILEPNAVVSVGTTSFVVFDREGDMQTIISPMLPSIVKVLQQEEAKEDKTPVPAAPVAPLTAIPEPVAKELEQPAHKTTALGAFILIGLLTGLLIIVGMGTLSLFRSEPVSVEEPININAALQEAISPFKNVTWNYNPTTGRLLIVGHVLTATEKNQLMYNLQALPFVRGGVDERGIIIDEYTVQQINPILSRNKKWRGVTLQTPQPGQFVLSGYLQSRDDAERLSEYISTNFPNLDHLERRIIVEEEVINSVEVMLQKVGIRDVKAKMNNGELTLTGGIPTGKEADYSRIVEETKTIPGVRNVRSFVSELPPEATLVNISDRYKVSGASNQGGVNLFVIINGRILGRGDSIEGMTITSIKPNVIFLEKDGVKYRIDY